MQRLGKKKAEKLNAEHPGVTLSSWLELNYKHVTLNQQIRDGGKTLTVPQLNVELTIALLSTDNVADWAKTAFHWAPSGTIIDKVPASYYESKILLLRQLLTKELVLNPDNKLANRYLSILERRDSDRWAAKKQALNVRAAATEEAEGGATKKVVFDFDIV